jgi:hypothetical protein
MTMFGITTFMFALGIIALVLNTVTGFQEANSDGLLQCDACYHVWETTTCLMVRLCDALLSSA